MANLPDRMPVSMARLPVNKAGYPVPWFVAKVDGDWDFRVVRSRGVQLALEHSLCWVCGQALDASLDAFLVGPMCAINHTSAEPPMHLACARWSAIACPFLANPGMVRREKHMPDIKVAPAGHMIPRNPGVALVWATRRSDWHPYRTQAEPKHGVHAGILFDIGVPRRVEWYAEGRAATRDEVLASIDTGLPLLANVAEAEGPEALLELASMHAAAMGLVPA